MSGVADSVTPYVAIPSVRYSAELPVGLPVLLMIGMPRELNTMQAVPEIAVPASSVQAGAWPMVDCVLGGGVPRSPYPKETPDESVVDGDSSSSHLAWVLS